MQKGRNKPHNILFTTQKLTAGMRLCDTALSCNGFIYFSRRMQINVGKAPLLLTQHFQSTAGALPLHSWLIH
jgi:hypothetical protein